jgi:hypothetical protein
MPKLLGPHALPPAKRHGLGLGRRSAIPETDIHLQNFVTQFFGFAPA